MMHIGRLARQAGTTTRTVRYYEEMGLIRPERRTEGGFRCYSKGQLERLQMVLSLKEMGFELEHIKSILEKRHHHPTGGTLAAAVLEDLRMRLGEVNAQVEHLCQVRNKLTMSINSLCMCVPCERQMEVRTCPDCHKDDARGDPLPFFHALPSGNGNGSPDVSRKKNKPSASRPPSS